MGVHIAADRCDRRDLLQPGHDVHAADVARVDDVLDPGERLQRPRDAAGVGRVALRGRLRVLSRKIVFVRHRQLRHREGFTFRENGPVFSAQSGEARAKQASPPDPDLKIEGQPAEFAGPSRRELYAGGLSAPVR